MEIPVFNKILSITIKDRTKPEPTITSAIYQENRKILRVAYSDGTTRSFTNEGSVLWRSLPMMDICSSELMIKLTDIFKYVEKYGNPYPTAHVSKGV